MLSSAHSNQFRLPSSSCTSPLHIRIIHPDARTSPCACASVVCPLLPVPSAPTIIIQHHHALWAVNHKHIITSAQTLHANVCYWVYTQRKPHTHTHTYVLYFARAAACNTTTHATALYYESVSRARSCPHKSALNVMISSLQRGAAVAVRFRVRER